MTADDSKTSAETTDSAQSAAAEPQKPVETEAPPAAGGSAVGPSAEEFAAVKDRLLRTLAEMENLRQRTAREMADARQYAVTNFAREMLAVGDNLRRAIEAVPKEMRQGDNKALAALIEGVEVTERGLEQALAKFGVRRIDARGQKFDPAVHQSIMEVETDAVAPGSVAEEIQSGYVIGERVLRPSLVALARKARTAPPSPANGAADPVKDEKPAEANDATAAEAVPGAGEAPPGGNAS
jgi:molecular chaperone GrpE